MLSLEEIEYDSILIHNNNPYDINVGIMMIRSTKFKELFMEFRDLKIKITDSYSEKSFFHFLNCIHGDESSFSELNLPELYQILIEWGCNKLALKIHNKIDPLIFLLYYIDTNIINYSDILEYEHQISNNLEKYITNLSFFKLPIPIIIRILSLNEKIITPQILSQIISNLFTSHGIQSLSLISLFDFSYIKPEDLHYFSQLPFIKKNSIFNFILNYNKSLEEDLLNLNIKINELEQNYNLELKKNKQINLESNTFKEEKFQLKEFIKNQNNTIDELQKQISNIKRNFNNLEIKKPYNFEKNFLIACKNGDFESVQFHLNNDQNIIFKTFQDPDRTHISNSTGLHKACDNNQFYIVQYLINNGSKIDYEDCDQRTPIHRACKKGNLKLLKLLINKGGNIKIKDKIYYFYL